MRHVDHAESDVEAVVRVEVVLELDGLVLLVSRLVGALFPLVRELEMEHDVLQVRADALLAIHDAQLEAVILLEELVPQKLFCGRPVWDGQHYYQKSDIIKQATASFVVPGIFFEADAKLDDFQHFRVVHLFHAQRTDSLNTETLTVTTALSAGARPINPILH